MEPAVWRSVESFEGATVEGGPADVLDALADDEALRLRSDAGGRAILLPARSLPVGAVSQTALPESVEVLFVEPATGINALSALATLGDRAGSVLVALPEGADAAGLIVQPGLVSLTLGLGSTTRTHRLFRAVPTHVEEQDRARVRAAPKTAESADVLAQRAKWFKSRESGGR